VPVPVVAARACETFLSELDSRAPGLAEGLYLCGSVALDDFHPPGSDVDFVAVLSGRPDAGGLAALAAAHAEVRRRHPGVTFEGTHLTRDELAAGPECGPRPAAFGKRFRPEGRFALNPITWHELATVGILIRAAHDLTVPTSADAVRAFSRANLTSYWRPWWHAARRPGPTALFAASRAGTPWSVLGVSRLHHAIATGTLTSKSGAGRYAREIFDARWHPIIDEALRIRADQSPAYRLPRRRREALAYLDMAIDAALALP
jgi:hypothetical protein